MARSLVLFVLVATSIAIPASAFAQSAVSLGEILPALAGTELGALAIVDAPPPGGVVTVRREDVRRALEAAGRSSEGLDIPSRTRIEREGEELDGDAIAALATSAVAEALAPCTADELTVRVGATVPAGEHTVSVEAPSVVRDGGVALTIILTTDGRSTRVSGQAHVTCPAPVIAPGQAVTVRVVAGSVVVTAAGVARETGRVGDRVRVRVEETDALLTGRVIDSHTVEVTP